MMKWVIMTGGGWSGKVGWGRKGVEDDVLGCLSVARIEGGGEVRVEEG